MKNPYIPLDVDNPSLAQRAQKNLYGEGLEERKKITREASSIFIKMWKGKEFLLDGSEDSEMCKKFFQLMCDDIRSERKRIGGDWAIASAIGMNKDWRQYIRYPLLLSALVGYKFYRL